MTGLKTMDSFGKGESAGGRPLARRRQHCLRRNGIRSWALLLPLVMALCSAAAAAETVKPNPAPTQPPPATGTPAAPPDHSSAPGVAALLAPAAPRTPASAPTAPATSAPNPAVASPAPGTAGTPAAQPGPPLRGSAPPPASPEPGVPTGPLTVEDAIAVAYRNHGDIAVAEQNLSSARARVTESRAGTLPNVTGGVTYQGTGVNDIGSIFGNLPQSTNFNPGPMPSLQLRNTVWDSGQTRLQVRAAQSNVRGAEFGLSSTRSNLAFQVTSNFYEQLRADRLEELSREQVRQSEEQLQLVEARIAAGTAAEVDRYQVQVEVANARVTLLRNQNQVRQAGAALRSSMGLPVGSPLNLAQTTPAEMKVPALDEAIAEANRSHPQIQQEVAAVDTARDELRLAGLRRRPILSTTTSLNLNPRDERTRSDWGFLAGVTMPIWDAGVTRAREKEARAGLESAQAREGQMRIDVSTAVQQAVLNIQNAKDRLDASNVAVDSATRNLEAANARYQQGLQTVVDITTAQLNNFQAQNNLISARYDYYIALAQLKRAMGQ